MLQVNLWPLAALPPVSRVLMLLPATLPMEASVRMTAYAKPPLTLRFLRCMALLSRLRVPVMNVVLFLLLQFRQVAVSRNRALELVLVVPVRAYSLVVMRCSILLWWVGVMQRRVAAFT